MALFPNYLVSHCSCMSWGRRGENLFDLGFTFRWRDLWAVAGLIITGWIAATIVTLAISLCSYLISGHRLNTIPKNVEFIQDSANGIMLLISIPFALVNPFAEELIARAYIIREIRFLSGSSITAICVSVGLQTGYHLYQGVAPALSYAAMFTIFSIYYVRTERIVPVILAHMFFDVTALVVSGIQHHHS